MHPAPLRDGGGPRGWIEGASGASGASGVRRGAAAAGATQRAVSREASARPAHRPARTDSPTRCPGQYHRREGTLLLCSEREQVFPSDYGRLQHSLIIHLFKLCHFCQIVVNNYIPPSNKNFTGAFGAILLR